MKKIGSFLNKHKKVLIVLVIIIIFILVILFSARKLIDYLTPNDNTSIYGDRCTATLISKDTTNSFKEFVKNQENISLTKFEVKCNLIDIIVNLDQDMEFETVQELGRNILTTLPEDVVKQYDIQLFVTSSNKEDLNYPKIGTHHKLINDEMNDEFVW